MWKAELGNPLPRGSRKSNYATISLPCERRYDIAAGSLLVTEAGGIVGNFVGDSDYLHKGDVLAGTPKVFGQMVNLLQPFAASVK